MGNYLNSKKEFYLKYLETLSTIEKMSDLANIIKFLQEGYIE